MSRYAQFSPLRSFRSVLINKWSIVAFLLVWEFVARAGLVSPIFVTPLSTVLSTIVNEPDFIARHLPVSIYRVVVGFAVGSSSGIVIGLMMGRVRVMEDVFTLPISIFYPVPKIGFIPLFIMWFGIGNRSKIAVISLATFFPVVLNTYQGAKGVEKEMVWAALSLGSSTPEVITRVVFPQILPNVFTGMRISAAVAWAIMVIAEMVGASDGIGFFLLLMQRQFQTKFVFASIIVIAFAGWFSQFAVKSLNERYNEWHFEMGAEAERAPGRLGI